MIFVNKIHDARTRSMLFRYRMGIICFSHDVSKSATFFTKWPRQHTVRCCIPRHLVMDREERGGPWNLCSGFCLRIEIPILSKNWVFYPFLWEPRVFCHFTWPNPSITPPLGGVKFSKRRGDPMRQFLAFTSKGVILHDF